MRLTALLVLTAIVGVLAALGIPGGARAACVPSLQTIATTVTSPVRSNGGAIAVTSSGKIAGKPRGVDARACSISIRLLAMSILSAPISESFRPNATRAVARLHIASSARSATPSSRMQW